MSRAGFRAGIPALVVAASLPAVSFAQTPSKALPMPTAPSKSLPATGRVARSFDAAGVQRVILRAGDAEHVAVKMIPGARAITVSGVPEGGAEGYHSPDPNWRETPASRWGMNFKARAFGTTLVVSTEKEIEYIHHHYRLEGLAITVPQGVELIKESRKLSGEGTPDLSPPGSH